MSQALDELQVGWQARLEYWGDDVSWSGGGSFPAIILPLNVIDPGALLGEDIRESDQMQVHRDNLPAIESGDTITRGNDSWKVVRRVNSAADFIAIFTLVKITDKDS